MLKGLINKNWIIKFINRHNNRLKNIYLRKIEGKRVFSKYKPFFKLFFDLVLLVFILIEIFC